jgi:hypothetical protein
MSVPYRGRKPVHYPDADEKAALAADQTELYIMAVRHTEGTYGERLEYDLEKAVKPGEIFRIAWARNAFRDQDALEIEEQLQEHDKVGPVRLGRFASGKPGRADAWGFESVADENKEVDDVELKSLAAKGQPIEERDDDTAEIA